MLIDLDTSIEDESTEDGPDFLDRLRNER